MSSFQHRTLGAFLFIGGLLIYVVGFSLGIAYLTLFCGTFCLIIGWYQWSLGGTKGPTSKSKKKLGRGLKGLLGFILTAFSIVFFIWGFIEDANSVLITIGTLLLIFGIVLIRGVKASTYNHDNDGLKRIDELETPIDKLYEDFKDIDTPLGKPWLSHVSTITDRDCIIWGPASNGSFVFGYYLSGTFNLSCSSDINWIKDKEAAKVHTLSDVNTNKYNGKLSGAYDLGIKASVEYYMQMLSTYAKTGAKVWPLSGNNSLDGKLYVFDENFYFTKQSYHLLDSDGNVVYNIEGTIPLKTFKIKNPNTGEEIFKITKRIFHIMDHYDFYYHGEKFGSFIQRFNLMHDIFEMNSSIGFVEMRSVSATFGKNYFVYVDGRLVGTIAEKLGVSIRDIIFDNYALSVYDEKYLSLLAGLAIMGEREKVRDNARYSD